MGLNVAILPVDTKDISISPRSIMLYEFTCIAMQVQHSYNYR